MSVGADGVGAVAPSKGIVSHVIQLAGCYAHFTDGGVGSVEPAAFISEVAIQDVVVGVGVFGQVVNHHFVVPLSFLSVCIISQTNWFVKCFYQSFYKNFQVDL